MKADKRSLALILALVLICTGLPVPAAQAADVQPVLSAALARQASAVPSPGYGDEWTVLGLARGGYYTADSDYFARYYADLAAKAPGADGGIRARRRAQRLQVHGQFARHPRPVRHRARRGAGRRVRSDRAECGFCMGEQSGHQRAHLRAAPRLDRLQLPCRQRGAPPVRGCDPERRVLRRRLGVRRLCCPTRT